MVGEINGFSEPDEMTYEQLDGGKIITLDPRVHRGAWRQAKRALEKYEAEARRRGFYDL